MIDWISWLQTIFSLLLGVAIGRLSVKSSSISEQVSTGLKSLTESSKQSSPPEEVGGVKRPDPYQNWLRDHPKQAEEDKAVEESIRKTLEKGFQEEV